VLLPVAQCGRADFDRAGEHILAHAESLPDRLYIGYRNFNIVCCGP
jgi:hypothetical protein